MIAPLDEASTAKRKREVEAEEKKARRTLRENLKNNLLQAAQEYFTNLVENEAFTSSQLEEVEICPFVGELQKKICWEGLSDQQKKNIRREVQDECFDLIANAAAWQRAKETSVETICSEGSWDLLAGVNMSWSEKLEHEEGAAKVVKEGNKPFHLAMRAVVTLYKNPEQNFERPLQAARELLKRHRKAARSKDSAGNLPLHSALNLLAWATETERKGRHRWDPCGTHIASLTELAMDLADCTVRSSLPKQNKRLLESKDANGRTALHIALDGKDLQEVARKLLRLHPAYAQIRINSFLPLHFILKMKRRLVPADANLLSELLSCNEGAAKEADADGNYPLHLAATLRSTVKRRSDGTFQLNDSKSLQKWAETALSKLIDANPEAASLWNGNWDLPCDLCFKWLSRDWRCLDENGDSRSVISKLLMYTPRLYLSDARSRCDVLKDQSIADLMGLTNVVYVGACNNDETFAARYKAHFRNANMYGDQCILTAYATSATLDNVPQQEKDLVEHFKVVEDQTWKCRGLCNLSDGGEGVSRAEGSKPGLVYVLVREDGGG